MGISAQTGSLLSSVIDRNVSNGCFLLLVFSFQNEEKSQSEVSSTLCPSLLFLFLGAASLEHSC